MGWRGTSGTLTPTDGSSASQQAPGHCGRESLLTRKADCCSS